jgi:hypothetical protein
MLGAAACNRAARYTPAAMADDMLGIYSRAMHRERAA